MSDLRDFVAIDVKRQVPVTTFRSSSLRQARRLFADADLSWNSFAGEEDPPPELFEKYGIDVREVDKGWLLELNTPKRIVGIDEVGLGSLAGPLVVCAFSAPDMDWRMPKLTDSKKLGKTARESLAEALMRDFPDHYVLIQAEAGDIDRVGVGKVLPMAMERALDRLVEKSGVPDRVIVDGEEKGILGAEYYPKADLNYPAVSAASVIAKVYRDGLMKQYAGSYPGYGFDQHMGYPTKQHREAISRLGQCPLHRRSYRLKETLEQPSG